MSKPFHILKLTPIKAFIAKWKIERAIFEQMEPFTEFRVSIVVRKNPLNGKMKCCAFLNFKFFEDAEQAFMMHKQVELFGLVANVYIVKSELEELPKCGPRQTASLLDDEDDRSQDGGDTLKLVGDYTSDNEAEQPGEPNEPMSEDEAAEQKSESKSKMIPKKIKKKLETSPNRCLYIGNLDRSIETAELISVFSKYGIVQNVEIKPGTIPAARAVYGFITYFNMNMAERAKKAMFGQKIGKTVPSIGYGKPTQTRCVWVGNIGPWTSEKKLYSEFRRFGEIEKIVLPEDRDFAYVLFVTVPGAVSALKQLNGVMHGEQPLKLDMVDVGLMDSNLNSDDRTKNWDKPYMDSRRTPEPRRREPFLPRAFAPRGFGRGGFSRGRGRGMMGRGVRPIVSEPEITVGELRKMLTDGGRGRLPDIKSRSRSPRRPFRDSSRDRNDSDRRKRRSPDRSISPVRNRHFRSRSPLRRRSRSPVLRSNKKPRRSRSPNKHVIQSSSSRQSHSPVRRNSKASSDRRGKSPASRSFSKTPEQKVAKLTPSPDRDGRKVVFKRATPKNAAPASKENIVNRPEAKYSKPGQPRPILPPAVVPNYQPPENTQLYPPIADTSYPPPPIVPQAQTYAGFSSTFRPSHPIAPVSTQSAAPQYYPGMSLFPSTAAPIPAAAAPVPRPQQHQTPPRPQHQPSASTVASRFPTVWSGAMVLKNGAFVVNLHLVSGSVLLVDALIGGNNPDNSNDCPVLKIAQRLRLDQPDKLEELDRRLRSAGRGSCSVLLATPAMAEVDDASNVIQQRPLQSLVTYLCQKEVAAVVPLPPSGAATARRTGILHAFPPCLFARNFLQREAPGIDSNCPAEDQLLVIVCESSVENS